MDPAKIHLTPLAPGRSLKESADPVDPWPVNAIQGSIRVLRTWDAHPALHETVQQELTVIRGIARSSGLCRISSPPEEPFALAPDLCLVFEFVDCAALLAWTDLPDVRAWSARLQALVVRDAQRIVSAAAAEGAVERPLVAVG